MPLVEPKPTISAPPKTHLSILDLLRGCAALFVVLLHFTADGTNDGGALMKLSSPFLHNKFTWGYVGVYVFFVISGFVIPLSLFGTGYRPRNFGSYLAKRIARICPPAYINILFIILQWIIIDYFIHHDLSKLRTISVGQVVSNLLFIVPFTDYKWFNGVFWTLAVEFQFYVVLGVLFNRLFRSGSLPVFIVFYVFVSLTSFIPGLPEHSFLKYSPIFAMGGICLLFYKNEITLYAYIGSLALFFGLAAWTNHDLLAALFGLATALIINFVRVQHPLFSFGGKISYSLYLTHFLVGSTLDFVLAKLFKPSTDLQHILLISVCIVLACVVAYAYYLLIEKPFILLARRLKI